MSITILLAALLHGGIALWLFAPETQPLPEKQPLKISLLATIAETTTNVASKVTPPQKKPEPEIKPAPVEPQTPVKPVPEPEKVEKQLEKIPEPVIEPSPPAPDAVATARYEQLLVAWLEKHKKYPRRAKRLRIEGEAILRILIDRSGQTRQVMLAQRTGNRLLDKAALEMAQRANPFPPMPQNDPRSQLEFDVPVAFVLR